jgi:hypothetical protein
MDNSVLQSYQQTSIFFYYAWEMVHVEFKEKNTPINPEEK